MIFVKPEVSFGLHEKNDRGKISKMKRAVFFICNKLFKAAFEATCDVKLDFFTE